MRGAGLIVVLLALAGCGARRMSVADCLNEEGFLVEGNAHAVRGTSAAGVAFTLTIYPSAAAARRAFAALDPATAAVIGPAVVDFSGNPPAVPGGAPGTLSKSSLALIRSCLPHP